MLMFPRIFPVSQKLPDRRIHDVAGEVGYFTAFDEELEPISSAVPGIFLAGTALGPKDIPETVSQASGAAAKVLSMFQHEKTKVAKVEIA